MKNLFITLTISFFTLNFYGQSIESPNAEFELNFYLDKKGRPFYNLIYKKEKIIENSGLGFIINNEIDITTNNNNDVDVDLIGDEVNLLNGFSLISISRSSKNETWKPIWGEESLIRNNYNELLVKLEQGFSGRLMNIRFRVFDSGLGFRYEFPTQKNLSTFIIKDEKTEFAMTGDHKAFWIPGDYDTQEYNYLESKLSEIKERSVDFKEQNVSMKRFSDWGVQTALMMKTSSGIYINLHEAALIEYSAMHLEFDLSKMSFESHLTPDAFGNMAYINVPQNTPWRTVIASDDAKDILSSRITYNLNEPNAIDDTSWIKPTKYMGVWWEMITGQSTWWYTNELSSVRINETDYSNLKPNGTHAANNKKVKDYIDFASKHGFDALLVEGWNIGWEDWFDRKKDYVFDFLTPYPDFDIDYLNKYAKEKGISLMMHHETSGAIRNYERHMDRAYALMNKFGYKSVKSGYVGRIIPAGERHYGQYMVNHYLHAIKKAADYKIMVNAHEAVRPTGVARTYPNHIGNESARGAEFRGSKANHTTILPFTRLIGGPMDYTPGIFEMDPRKNRPGFQPNLNETIPPGAVTTTLANQLGLYVVMYSPLQMAADLPKNYMRFPDAFQFIKDVALDWDKSVYLEAEPGRFITIARKEKNSDNWFVGNSNGYNTRNATVDFSFLDGEKKYVATIYRDGKEADYLTKPQEYVVESKIITSKTKLKIRTVAAGGFAISVYPNK